IESHQAKRGLCWRARLATRRDQNSRPARLRSALLGTGRRSTTAPLKRTSESWESRCWPVETSSSPREQSLVLVASLGEQLLDLVLETLAGPAVQPMEVVSPLLVGGCPHGRCGVQRVLDRLAQPVG